MVPAPSPTRSASAANAPAWRRSAIWGGYALLLLAAPLLWRSSLGHTLLAQMGIAVIACLAYNVLFGQGGMLSFGHAVYSGLGAYLAIHTLRAMGEGSLALPVALVPLVGGLAGLVCAALLGYLTTRRAGTTFAMITLGIGELVWSLALMMPEVFGGEGGISANRAAGASRGGLDLGPPLAMYYLVAAYCFVCTVLLYAFTHTPLGRLLNAVRDNPERVAFIGCSARHVRYLAFMVSGTFAGIAGGLGALNFEIVGTEVLGTARSGAYLLFVFIGGATFFWGPIVGAVLMVLAQMFSALTPAWLLYLGLLFIAMVLYAPAGVAGLLVDGARRWTAPGTRAHPRPRAVAWALLQGAAALTALAAAAAIVEMAHHLRLDSAAGRPLHYLGLALDAHGATTWAACVAAAVLAALLFAVARRRRMAAAIQGGGE